MKGEKLIICVDFDGTCTTHDYPRIGKDIGAVPVLLKLIENGHKLILFTMRGNTADSNTLGTLDQAVNWFKENNIPLYGVQTNPGQRHWTNSPKAYAQIYIDDAALGCPLIIDNEISDRPFVDWNRVEDMLISMGLIKFKPSVSPKDIDMSKVKVTVKKYDVPE